MQSVMLRTALPFAARPMATRTAGRASVVVKAGKCACGKTSDAAGNCDGSHAKKMCGCTKTSDPKGFCDGSHAKPACACGKTNSKHGLCDGSHAK